MWQAEFGDRLDVWDSLVCADVHPDSASYRCHSWNIGGASHKSELGNRVEYTRPRRRTPFNFDYGLSAGHYFGTQCCKALALRCSKRLSQVESLGRSLFDARTTPRCAVVISPRSQHTRSALIIGRFSLGSGQLPRGGVRVDRWLGSRSDLLLGLLPISRGACCQGRVPW